MSDHGCRWVFVAAGGVMGCVAMGALFASPVLLTPMAEVPRCNCAQLYRCLRRWTFR